MEKYSRKSLQNILQKIEEIKNEISAYDYKCESGIICPECGIFNNVVINSKENKIGFKIRRRMCLKCGNRWNTVEIITEMGCVGQIDN